MGQQVAFVLLVAAPMLLVAIPLLVAYRRDRRAKAARLQGPGDGVTRS